MNTLHKSLGIRKIKKDQIFVRDVSHLYPDIQFESIHSNRNNTQVKFVRVQLIFITQTTLTIISNGEKLLKKTDQLILETADKTTISSSEYKLLDGNIQVFSKILYDKLYATFIINVAGSVVAKSKSMKMGKSIVAKGSPIINSIVPVSRNNTHMTISKLTVGSSVVGNKILNTSGSFNLNNVIYSDTIDTLNIGSTNTVISGNLIVNGTINNETSSDSRLKTKVEQIGSTLDKIIGLNGVKFLWSDNEKNIHPVYTGFIAQNVREYIPEIVYGDETKETLKMSYIGLIPYLVECIKDLKRENDNLREDVVKLKKIVESMNV